MRVGQHDLEGLLRPLEEGEDVAPPLVVEGGGNGREACVPEESRGQSASLVGQETLDEDAQGVIVSLELLVAGLHDPPGDRVDVVGSNHPHQPRGLPALEAEALPHDLLEPHGRELSSW